MRKRSKSILLRFTPKELEALNQNASKTNLSRESYCRNTLLGATVKEAPCVDFPMLIRELRGIRIALEEALARNDAPAIRLAAESCREVEMLIWDTYTTEGK